jgi:SET domain
MSKSEWRPVAQIHLALFQETGRGLMAAKTIEKDELIVKIPYRLLITRARVLEELPQLSKQLTTAELLTLYLLYCKKNNIDEEYLETLPKEYSIGGLCFDEEVECLPNSLRDKVLASKIYMHSKYEKLKSIAGFIESLEMFLWAWCSVNTRAVYLKDGGHPPEGNMALAPYLDLLNHDSKAVIEAAFNKTTNCYEIRTKEKIKKFQQIFINYGPHDNMKLFMEYGFIVPSNIHSTVQFDEEDLLQLLKTKNPQSLQLLISELSKNFYCNWDGLSWNLQVALTIMSKDSLDNIKSPYEVQPEMNPATKTLASRLLEDKISQLTPKEASSILNPSPSFQVAQFLISDMLHLLNHTMSTLSAE